MLRELTDRGKRWPLGAMAVRPTEPPARPAASGNAAQLPLAGKHVLVVEDESLIALLLVDALEDAGALVVGPCYTLEECLRACRSEHVDAAVLDVDLAGRDVFPAADALRERHVPFLFHTAHADRHELVGRFGEVPVCRKPVDMDDLIALVVRIVASGRAN